MATYLVVDDDEAILGMFAKRLRPLGEVRLATNGFDALKALARTPFEAVVLDLFLPGLDGFGVLQILRSRPGPNRATPVVVVTADASGRTHARLGEAGVAFVCTKPVRSDQLAGLVASAARAGAARAGPSAPSA